MVGEGECFEKDVRLAGKSSIDEEMSYGKNDKRI